MIYITGDTHGDWMSRLNSEAFPEGKDMTKDDYVIICGDFGIWRACNQEEYHLNWLDEKTWTTLFVDGNHENFDRLNNDYPVEEWHGGKVHKIRDSVIHMMRGQVFEIEGMKVFTFGGASSHDTSDGILDPNAPDFAERKNALLQNPYSLFRIKGESWWPEELPSQEEMDEAIHNLEKHDWKVDYVITHSPDSNIIGVIGDGTYETDILSDFMLEIRDKLQYRQWFFGHMHLNQNFYAERAACLYEQIVRVL